MIPALAIATGLLAVLDDDASPDFDELLRRAMAFDRPELFLDRLSKKKQRKFFLRVKIGARVPSADQAKFLKIRTFFFPNTTFSADGCPLCGTTSVFVEGALCDACRDPDAQYEFQAATVRSWSYKKETP